MSLATFWALVIGTLMAPTIRIHRAKFENRERASIKPYTRLAEQDWQIGCHLQRKYNHDDKGKREHAEKQADNEVNQTFTESFVNVPFVP